MYPVDAWRIFLSYVPQKGHILDAGCGSGRDSKYFLEQGYQVTSMDISENMAQLAESYIQQKVSVGAFEDIVEESTYYAIWCYASLLHVRPEALDSVFVKLKKALKHKGILFMCFKHGDVNHVSECGRFYYDMNDERFDKLNMEEKGWKIEENWIQPCPRVIEKNRPDWYTVILRKV